MLAKQALNEKTREIRGKGHQNPAKLKIRKKKKKEIDQCKKLKLEIQQSPPEIAIRKMEYYQQQSGLRAMFSRKMEYGKFKKMTVF